MENSPGWEHSTPACKVMVSGREGRTFLNLGASGVGVVWAVMVAVAEIATRERARRHEQGRFMAGAGGVSGRSRFDGEMDGGMIGVCVFTAAPSPACIHCGMLNFPGELAKPRSHLR